MQPDPPWLNPMGAYIHVPFCAHHCGYCDFAVTAGHDHLIELYLEALSLELATLGMPREVETIFLGGGTPTYLSVPQLERLLRDFARWLPLRPGGEFSIESTPESLSDEKCATLAAGGVNRVSIGVQTFQGHLLPVLDRVHFPEHVAPAIEMVKRHRMQVSLDLIFGIPGQSLADWEADLAFAIAFESDHLSTYGLTYEKGTPLWKDRERGRVKSLEEELELEMYLCSMDCLTRAGFEHYEISNFAKPGRRCRHNEIYWANHAYDGFGVGAARFVQGSRELNVRDTNTYIRKIFQGESPTFQRESLAPRARAFETIAIQLRRSCGIVRESFRTQTGFDVDDLIKDQSQMLSDQGLLEVSTDFIRLSQRGKCVADSIIQELYSVETCLPE